MTDFLNFLVSQWMTVLAIGVVVYLLLQDEQEQDTPDHELTPQELTFKINNSKVVIFDIRAKDDYRAGHIEGSKHIGLSDDADTVKKLIKQNNDIVIVCYKGVSSLALVNKVRQSRQMKTYSLKGGMKLWQEELFPVTVDAEFAE